MTRAGGTAADPRRGSVRGGSLQVRSSPASTRDGPRRYLSESVNGTDRAARREAEKVLARLQAEVDGQRSAQRTVTLGYTIDEWLATVEIEGRHLEGLHPDPGDLLRGVGAVPDEVWRSPARRAPGRGAARLRTGGMRPSRVPAIGRVDRSAGARCQQRCAQCGGALELDRRQRGARRPRQRPPQPDPPSPSEAARLVDGAVAVDGDWGTLVWLVMTTGMRRGEVCALRWSRVDLDAGIVDVRRSYRLRHGVGTEKDTKTYQMRRIALDNETVVLLVEHKERCARRLHDLGADLVDDMYVFSNSREFEPTQPVLPALGVEPVPQPRSAP